MRIELQQCRSAIVVHECWLSFSVRRRVLGSPLRFGGECDVREYFVARAYAVRDVDESAKVYVSAINTDLVTLLDL